MDILFVKLPTMKTLIMYDVPRSKSVEGFKKMIQDKEGYPPDQQIIQFEYTGKILENQRLLSDYDIQSMSSLMMRIRTPVRRIISATGSEVVLKHSTTSHRIMVKKTDTVLDLKRHIKSATNIPILSQDVIKEGRLYAERMESDSSTMEDYKVPEGCIFHLHLKRHVSEYSKPDGRSLVPNDVNKIIIEEASSKRKTSLYVYSEQTVGDVKMMIGMEEGIFPERCKLILNGNYMIGDHKKLKDFKSLKTGSVIYNALRPHNFTR